MGAFATARTQWAVEQIKRGELLPVLLKVEPSQLSQMAERIERGEVQLVSSGNWKLPDWAVVFIPRDIVQEYRELLLDQVVAGGKPIRTKGLWQAALGRPDRRDWPQKPRELFRKFGVRVSHAFLARFYFKVTELRLLESDGPKESPRVAAVRRAMQEAYSRDERTVWQSLLEDLTKPGGEKKPPALAWCENCGQPFTPLPRSNARVDVCQQRECRLRADADRKRRAYVPRRLRTHRSGR